jgi:undecaprenyl-diphosphatase
MYAIVIQLGAILALFAYFWRRIVHFTRTFPGGGSDQPPAGAPAAPGTPAAPSSALLHPLSLILIAFLCTAIPAFALRSLISANLESLRLMAITLIVGGILMWIIDVACRRPRTLAALFPGASRSMTTIAAGQLAGMSRPAALEFSFFLSIPTMIVATGYELLRTVVGGTEAGAGLVPEHMDAHRWIVLGIGFVISFVVALGVIAWFMNWVRRHGFVPFAIYRIILGTVVLVLLQRGALQ